VDLADSGQALPEHERMLALMRRYANPYGPKAEGSQTEEPHKVSVLYYPGCTTTRMADEIVQAMASILNKLQLDAAVFEEDTCCGIPPYEIGQVPDAKEVAERTLELIGLYEPDVVLTTCPACYKAFHTIYPEELGLSCDFEVQHITEFLLPRVAERMAGLDERVTWHDPCILGRHLGIYDEPRELLQSIPGLEVVEMHSNREDALCCGAGGGVYFCAQRTARQAVDARLEQAQASGAEEIITSCPNCHVRFRQGSRVHRMDLRARSLTEIIDAALTDAESPDRES
jgi:Fe-S oxidoreductase